MAKQVTPRTYFLIVAAVFVAMVVVTLVVFLTVQRAAYHLPGARPDLSGSATPAPDTVTPGSPSDPPRPREVGHSDPQDRRP
ncbi:MAG TPA: hypothetical protein VGB12_07355 [bacterium]|jgi:hypothetical protein